mgnify:FL=1
MKIAVIGAGSTYTPGLIARWTDTKRDRIPVTEFCLYDINSERLDIVGNYIIETAKRTVPELKVTKTTNLEKAIEGASFVIIQIRAGLNTQRLIDERICVEHGFVGQETTGPAGWALALRQIPAVIEIAKAVERISPDAWIISVANPAGILAEALIKYGHKKSIGMCHGGYYPRQLFSQLLGVDMSRIDYDYYGLNHVAWIPNIYVDGQRLPEEKNVEIAKRIYADWAEHELTLPQSFAEDYCPPITVHHYMREFFMHDEVVAEMKRTNTTRATRVIEIEKACLDYYKKNCGIKFDIPPDLSRRGGDIEDSNRKKTNDYGAIGYSDGCMAIIDALYNGGGQEIIINVLNKGALNGIPDDAVVEVSAKIYKDRYERKIMGDIPISIRGHIQMIKAYETMTVEAAITGDRNLALKALMSNPICFCRYQRTKVLCDALLDANKDFLPQFK